MASEWIKFTCNMLKHNKEERKPSKRTRSVLFKKGYKKSLKEGSFSLTSWDSRDESVESWEAEMMKMNKAKLLLIFQVFRRFVKSFLCFSMFFYHILSNKILIFLIFQSFLYFSVFFLLNKRIFKGFSMFFDGLKLNKRSWLFLIRQFSMLFWRILKSLNVFMFF